MGAITPPRRNLAGYAKRRKPFAGADASSGQHNGLCRNISFLARKAAGAQCAPLRIILRKPEFRCPYSFFISYTQKSQTRSFLIHMHSAGVFFFHFQPQQSIRVFLRYVINNRLPMPRPRYSALI